MFQLRLEKLCQHKIDAALPNDSMGKGRHAGGMAMSLSLSKYIQYSSTDRAINYERGMGTWIEKSVRRQQKRTVHK